MVPDPYKALGLPNHDATQTQIKLAYRKLAKQYHPDRLTRLNATAEEQAKATTQFAAISAAYQLLTDERRKRDYDHIYKYGGYDDEEDTKNNQANPQTPPRTSTPSSSRDPADPFTGSNKRARATGIGYTVVDPLTYVLSKGQKQSKSSVGIQIPSRMHLAHPPPGGGLRFAYSSGEYNADSTDGSKQYVSKTTQFVQGKKYTRVETTTLHPDGRKEVIIEGNDYVERKVTNTPRKQQKRKVMTKSAMEEEVASKAAEELPWYLSTWHVIREKLTSCTNPCIQVQ